MKKLLSLLFAVIIVFTAIPTASTLIADAAVSGIFTYSINSDGTVTIDSIKSSAKKVVIPEKIKGKDVTSFNWNAYSSFDNITSLTIPSTLNNFAYYMLGRAVNLTEINVAKNNAYYSSYQGVLYNKDYTQMLHIPENKKGSVTVHAMTKSVAYFSGCPKLTSIKVNSNNKNFVAIDGVLYSKDKTRLVACPGGKSGKVTVPASVTEISWDAFGGCKKITAININSKNKNYSSIDGVVYDKKKTSIVIVPVGKTGTLNVPASVYYIPEYDLAYGYNSLKKFNVNAKNKTYSSVDGVLYTKDKTALLLCPSKKTGKITIPDKTKYISEHAFNECHYITALHLGAGICNPKLDVEYTAIDGGNFSGCIALKTVTVSPKNKYYTIYNGAIYNKKKTELVATLPKTISLTIPSSVKSIGYRAVSYTDVKNVKIPNSVTDISYNAFMCAYNLTSVKIPNKVKSIDWGTFNSCESLVSVSIPKSVKTINDYPFDGCPKFKKIYYAGTKAEFNKIEKQYAEIDDISVTYNSKGCTSHKFESKNTCICSKCGYTETGKCIKKIKGTWYYFSDGIKDKSNTLVKHTDGKLYHVKGGKRVKDTAIVKYKGKRYYVKNGVVSKVTKTVKIGKKYYKVKKGIVV